tara:strand:+ start:1223 stop:1918 length:696 start_codon:yes stop_codon:yes gene_type:complete
MHNKKIFIACDTNSISKAKKIISQTSTNKLDIYYKFGLQFFYSKEGRSFLRKLNKKFFLDLKLNDIPQTCISAINSIKDLKNCRYITAHANGGLSMLKAIKKETKKINKKIKVLGVTVLTSLDNKSLKQMGYTKSVENLVLHQFNLCKSAGLDGIVCSAKEAGLLKNKIKNLEIFCPGIRFSNSKTNDQKRVATAKDAFYKYGASAIVIGRPITQGNIKSNLKKLIKHLNT